MSNNNTTDLKDSENPDKYGKDPACYEKLNNYANHKNYAKGLVDIALIVANAGQLVRFTINIYLIDLPLGGQVFNLILINFFSI